MAPKQYSNFHCAYICEQLQTRWIEMLHTDELPFKLSNRDCRMCVVQLITESKLFIEP